MDADAIIVGSGFGGAVAAARLAQAGFDVVVLERGRRWKPGSFPRAPRLDNGWLWQNDHGLYDIRWLDRMASVQGAGWGGGSLVYANVFARPADTAMSGRWPSHLRRAELDPYYDLAAHMIGIDRPGIDPRTGRVPPRTEAVEKMMAASDIRDAVVRPNLAVTFGDPETWRNNMHGVPRRGCTFVGECILGCNHGAKNTLDTSYLAVAEDAGARAMTDTEVVGIRPISDGYAVTSRTPSDPSAGTREWCAPRVFLAAGAVATTELLLRAREIDRTLPDLSARLGSGFSGNGDYVTIADLHRADSDMTTGPTITTSTVLDVPEGRKSVWFQVQDGAYPPLLQQLVDEVLPIRRLRRTWQRLQGIDPRHRFAVLAMGHDAADGVLRLDKHGEASLSWRNRWQAHLYRAQARVGPVIARSLRARVAAPVSWSLFRRPVTVHPLGGVPTGRDGDEGAVDHIGQVHGHEGLYVVDGAVIPAATGVNPSATILAAAERALEHIIRDAGYESWRAPEWHAVAPVPVPEDAAFAFMAQRRASTAGDGVIFAERMRSRNGIALTLAARIPSIERFLADPAHEITVSGTLTSLDANPAEVEGTISLFPEGRPETMAYALHQRGGNTTLVTGVKVLHGGSPWVLLRGLTTLRTTIPSRTGKERMLLTIAPSDLIRLFLSIRGEGFTRSRRLRAVARFGWFFVASIIRREKEWRHISPRWVRVVGRWFRGRVRRAEQT